MGITKRDIALMEKMSNILCKEARGKGLRVSIEEVRSETGFVLCEAVRSFEAREGGMPPESDKDAVEGYLSNRDGYLSRAMRYGMAGLVREGQRYAERVSSGGGVADETLEALQFEMVEHEDDEVEYMRERVRQVFSLFDKGKKGDVRKLAILREMYKPSPEVRAYYKGAKCKRSQDPMVARKNATNPESLQRAMEKVYGMPRDSFWRHLTEIRQRAQRLCCA